MSVAAPLWLIALAPVALVGAVVWMRRSAGSAALPFVLRALAAVAVVVALAQPQTGPRHPKPTVLVLDRSTSVGSAGLAPEQAWVRTAIREHACANPCRVVTFGRDAGFSSIPKNAALSIAASLDAHPETDLAAALNLATGALPRGGRAVVLSDGFPTTGDAAAAAQAARRAGVTIDGVALPPNPAPDAAVTRLTAPSPLHAGDPLTLQATIRSTVPGSALLTLSRDGAPLGRQTIQLRAGDNPLFLTYRAPDPGWHDYRLTVSLNADGVPGNDALDVTTRVAAAPRVLVVEGEAGSAGTLPAVLARDGIDTTTTSADDLPTSARALANDDAIVLADVPAKALTSAQTTALQSAVRQGAGLLVLGGEHSLSLGRYAGTPLDAILPVQSLRPGGLRRRQLALELVLDRSSSMNDLAGGGLEPKIAMARLAARSALAATARDDDGFGLVAFDASAHVYVPLQTVTPGSVGAVGQQIDTLDANGGTDILHGLQTGLAQVEQSSAPVKHVLLMSDGISEPGDTTSLLARMHRDHVTLSTVALGQDADTALLRRLAREGGGRFYDVPDARSLPRVFALEARRSAPSVGVRAPLSVNAGGASPLLASLSGKTLPPLDGTVLTRLRPGASAPLTADVNGSATPVLAQWQYGLGRVVVWTPGAGGLAGSWLTSEPSLFTDSVRWSERGVATPALQPSLSPDGTQLVVDPLGTAGDALDLGRVTGELTTPTGAHHSLTFDQVRPSRYVAPLAGGTGSTAGTGAADAPPSPGVYGISVTAGGSPPNADALIAVPYPAELRPQPADASVLGGIAGATGGHVLPANAPATALRPDTGTALWRIPAGAGIVLLLAAVAAGQRTRARPSR